jgi:Protein of unknown function (DUF4435)
MNRDEKEALYFKSLLIRLRKDVAVRIEAVSDVPFWSFVFKMVLPHLKPEFYPQSNEFPSANTTGKKCVLLLKEYADKELILCVDSDYDYLLENPKLKSPFIFQTYTYSFENYHCYSSSLKKVWQNVVNTEGVAFDFEEFLKDYSQIIHELLIQSLWIAHNQPANVINIEEKLGKAIMLPKHFKSKSIQGVLDDFKIHIEQKLKDNILPTSEFRDKLASLGLTSENAYLFARVKNVFANVLTLLNNLKENYKNHITLETEAIIDRNERNKQRQTIFKAFKKSDECLKENLDFKECFLFKKLEQDLTNAFQ